MQNTAKFMVKVVDSEGQITTQTITADTERGIQLKHIGLAQSIYLRRLKE